MREFKNAMLKGQYIIPDPSKDELWFQFTKKRIEKSISKDQWLESQEIANEWAEGVCDRLGLAYTGVWKFFKRSLVARWFGQVEKKRFLPGWSIEEALKYAYCFMDRTVRFSLFPDDIACHAQSYQLPADQRDQWANIIAEADNSIAMEMFPEASTSKTICFRRYSTRYGERIFFEAGKGQAMFVFEQERGQHTIVSAYNYSNGYNFARTVPGKHGSRTPKEIETKLKALIKTHDKQLGSKCFGLCRRLGIDSVSIEGYWDPEKPNNMIVVDLDLPFDVVFMVSASC